MAELNSAVGKQNIRKIRALEWRVWQVARGFKERFAQFVADGFYGGPDRGSSERAAFHGRVRQGGVSEFEGDVVDRQA